METASEQNFREKANSNLIASALLVVVIIVFTVFWGNLMVDLYQNGRGSVQDIASINQAIWNTSRGNILNATILYEGFRDHLEPVLILYSFNYIFGGSIYSLLYIHAFLLTLGAVPLYLMWMKRRQSAAEALLVAFCYFLLPPIYKVLNHSYLRPDLLFFPVLTFMAFSLVFSNKKCLAVSIILALFCKESAAFIILGLGFYYLFFIKRYKLSLILILLGILWVPLVSKVFLPVFMGVPTFHFGRIIGPSEIPNSIISLLKSRWFFLFTAMMVFLLIKKRWEVIVSIPHTIGIIFFIKNFRYIIPVIPITFFLFFDLIALWDSEKKRRLLLAVIPFILIVTNINSRVWDVKEAAGDIPNAEVLIERIPREASVCCDRRLLVQLSTRERLYEFNRKHYFSQTGRDYLDAEYFIINRNGKITRPFRRHWDYEKAIKEMDALELELIAESQPWTLYRQRGVNLPK